MKAKLKGMWVDSPDFCLEKDFPDELDCFFFLVNLKIGPEAESGFDYFSVNFCTPDWLCKNHWVPELMRHTLLVRRYDLIEMRKTIENYIDQCEGNDWMEVAQKLARVFAWEYEDYQP